MRTLRVSVISLALLVGSTIPVAAQDAEDRSSRPPIPSAGCGTSEVEAGMHRDRTIAVGEDERTWAMYVPMAHEGVTPVPLWIQLHGGGGSGWLQLTLLQGDAEEYGFAMVGPDADVGRAGWTWREEDPELDTSLSNPDIALIEALIDDVASELCLDLARVYVAGYSAGGEGASVIGCVLEDKVAAVAPAAAMLDVGDACELDRPVPFLAVHGTNDRLAYFDGGYSIGYNDFPVVQALAQTSIPERVTNVALRNGCGPEPSTEAIDEQWERWSWPCPAGAEVELVAHSGGHDWDPNPFAPPSTTQLVWEFFKQHPMPE